MNPHRKSVAVSIRLPQSLHQHVQTCAEAEDRSVSSYIAQLVRQDLDTRKKLARIPSKELLAESIADFLAKQAAKPKGPETIPDPE